MCTHDELLPRKVNVVDGAADDDRSLSYGGNVWVASVREEDGRICTMHDELQSDVVLQIKNGLKIDCFLFTAI